MTVEAVTTEFSDRLKALPPYLFVEIDKIKNKLIAKGVDVIDLGIGDPDQPTPDPIIDALNTGAKDPKNHRYATNYGMIEFRKAIARWFKNRFGVELNPENEILPLLGAKEGIGHIPLAFVNPGDVVLIPDPAYPVYRSGTLFAGGAPYYIPIKEQNDYLPVLEGIPQQICEKARMIFINYPNNPTTAVAEIDFFQKTVQFAKKNNIFVCHDAAYCEVSYDSYQCKSFMQVEGAKDVGIEFHSFSKTFNMTGWRIAYAVGNPQILAGLAKIKSNVDSGMFQALQVAAIAALTEDLSEFRKNLLTLYQQRRDILCDGFSEIGWKIKKPKASFYVWAPVPEQFTSAEIAKELLEKAGVVVTPGSGFGRCGEGYIRMTLTIATERLKETVERIAPLYKEWQKK